MRNSQPSDYVPRSALVTDEQVDEALHNLNDGVAAIAAARARAVKAEHMLKHVKSYLIAQSHAKSLQNRENEAMADPRFIEAVEELSQATHDYELERARRGVWELIIEVWRTASANQRQVKL